MPDRRVTCINSLEVSLVPQLLSPSRRRADRQISIRSRVGRGGEARLSKPPRPIPLLDVQPRKPSLSLWLRSSEVLSYSIPSFSAHRRPGRFGRAQSPGSSGGQGCSHASEGTNPPSTAGSWDNRVPPAATSPCQGLGAGSGSFARRQQGSRAAGEIAAGRKRGEQGEKARGVH